MSRSSKTYGYLAILILTFFEGETIVILAGVAAHLGLLELHWVILSALAGSFGGDQFYYYLGRHWGPKIIAKRLSWREGAEKVYKLLHRHQYFLILTFRFYYGLWCSSARPDLPVVESHLLKNFAAPTSSSPTLILSRIFGV